MGWANRIIGLRDGRMVLDQAVTELDEAQVMDVYRRVEPGSGATTAAQPANTSIAQAS
jgi:phosphonate transport system ATP-binding protein